MSMRYKGAVISATPPTITPPVDGEGGSAPGIWTMEQQFQNSSSWPKPILQGQLWSWGRNTFGQLGIGNITNYSSPKQIGSLTNWTAVSASASFSAAIKTDGTLWAWGNNISGQLGTGNTTDQDSPIQVGSLTDWLSVVCGYAFTVAVKTNGTLWAWGNGQYGKLGLNNETYYSSPKQVGALTTWSTVQAGTNFSSAIVKTT